MTARVTARFNEIVFDTPIVVQSEHDSLEITAVIDESEVVGTLRAREHGPRSKDKDEEHWSFYCDRVLVTVSREDQFDIPEGVRISDTTVDVNNRTNYIEEKALPYANAARTFVSRLVTFCKHELHQPIDWIEHSWNPQFLVGGTPVFYDEQGERICCYVQRMHVVGPAPGLRDGFPRTCPLSSANIARLDNYFLDPNKITVSDDFLADAQLAYYARRLKRAVIELAIAVETHVKWHYFGGSPRAHAAFDAIEDSGSKGSFIEWIGRHAQRIHGRSFASDHPDDYRNVDHLFRTRNKVVHRGTLKFRDDSGNEIEVDRDLLRNWWESVHVLFEWLGQFPD